MVPPTASGRTVLFRFQPRAVGPTRRTMCILLTGDSPPKENPAASHILTLAEFDSGCYLQPYGLSFPRIAR